MERLATACCADCDFYKPPAAHDPDKRSVSGHVRPGFCQRYPDWKAKAPDHWCGEFRAEVTEEMR